jgi:hypothetical protein
MSSSAVVSVTSMNLGAPPEDWEDDDTGDTIYVPPGFEDDSIEEGASVANDTTGAYLAPLPVVAENGYSEFVWVQEQQQSPNQNNVSWNPAYRFTSDIPFTHFSIPEPLPGGDSEFKVLIGEYEMHVVHAGEPFVFTDYMPNGARAFLLTGFDPDPALAPEQAYPYRLGFRFASEGPTFLKHASLSPGDYTLGGLVNDDDYKLWRTSFSLSGEMQADGNNDGVVDATDYVVWREWSASDDTMTPEAGAVVREPTAPALVALALVLLVCRWK